MFFTVLAVMISDKRKPTDVDEALRDIARHGITTIPVPRQALARLIEFSNHDVISLPPKRFILSYFLKNIVPSIMDMNLESFAEW